MNIEAITKDTASEINDIGKEMSKTTVDFDSRIKVAETAYPEKEGENDNKLETNKKGDSKKEYNPDNRVDVKNEENLDYIVKEYFQEIKDYSDYPDTIADKVFAIKDECILLWDSGVASFFKANSIIWLFSTVPFHNFSKSAISWSFCVSIKFSKVVVSFTSREPLIVLFVLPVASSVFSRFVLSKVTTSDAQAPSTLVTINDKTILPNNFFIISLYLKWPFKANFIDLFYKK